MRSCPKRRSYPRRRDDERRRRLRACSLTSAADRARNRQAFSPRRGDAAATIASAASSTSRRRRATAPIGRPTGRAEEERSRERGAPSGAPGRRHRFDAEAVNVLMYAQQETRRANLAEVGTEQVLLGCLQSPAGRYPKLRDAYSLSMSKLRTKFESGPSPAGRRRTREKPSTSSA